jgi:hypothetical protein
MNEKRKGVGSKGGYIAYTPPARREYGETRLLPLYIQINKQSGLNAKLDHAFIHCIEMELPAYPLHAAHRYCLLCSSSQVGWFETLLLQTHSGVEFSACTTKRYFSGSTRRWTRARFSCVRSRSSGAWYGESTETRRLERSGVLHARRC